MSVQCLHMIILYFQQVQEIRLGLFISLLCRIRLLSSHDSTSSNHEGRTTGGEDSWLALRVPLTAQQKLSSSSLWYTMIIVMVLVVRLPTIASSSGSSDVVEGERNAPWVTSRSGCGAFTQLSYKERHS